MKTRLFNTLVQIEPLFFAAAVGLNVLPVLLVKYFPTVDGPAHLYNAQLIASLWGDPTQEWASFLDFNDRFTPNWSGHSVLALLLYLVPPFLAEKAILLFYLVGTPVFIRRLMSRISDGGKLFSYLVFPFLYSYLFHYGFFNYSIAVVLFFIGIDYWVRSENFKKRSSIVWIYVISVLLALTHPFVFCLYSLVVVIIELSQLMFKSCRVVKWSFVLTRLTTILPGACITLFFLIGNDTLNQQVKRIPWSDLYSSLKYFMPIKGIEMHAYALPAKVLLYLFSFIMLFGTGLLIAKRVRLGSNTLQWFILSGVTLVLIFVMPDYYGAAGLISARLMWFFFVFLILLFSTIRFPLLIRSAVALIGLCLGIWSTVHNYNSISRSSETATEIMEAVMLIKPESTVVPVSTRCSRPFTQITHYAGVGRNLLLLSNYEAALNYFPLVWNYENIPEFRIGEMGPSNCVHWIGGRKSETVQRQVDYVLWVKEPECLIELSCRDELNKNLKNSYHQVFSNEGNSVVVYERNSL